MSTISTNSFKPINVIVNGKFFSNINIYKISEHASYFSIKEISKIYNANLKWKSVNSRVIMYLNNNKIDIKANITKVIFGKKTKKISLPPLLIKNNIYIPSEILTSKEFLEISETNTVWDSLSSTLNITTSYPNISTIEYFTSLKNTQILIKIKESLSYEISKTANSITIKILNNKNVHHNYDRINVNNGVIKDIVQVAQMQSTLIIINFSQNIKFGKISNLLNPNRVLINVIHSENTSLLNSREELFNSKNKKIQQNNNNSNNKSKSEKIDLITPEQYGEAQMNGFISLDKKNIVNEEFEKILVTNFKNENIIDDSLIISDDSSIRKNIIPILSQNQQSNFTRHKKIIVLDAGHGGKDPGAIGSNGTKEKDINLEIVLELKQIFNNNNDYEVILTRKDDTFISLAERTNIANKHNADLFISIHCNANLNKNLNWFEIYFLSEKATDSQAAATAILENSVLKLEGNLGKKHTPLESMLWSMTLNEHMNESSELGSFIASEIPNKLNIRNNGVKQANFYVLRGAQMPAVLVESAFISNYDQEIKFGLKSFRVAIADSIYNGVIKYYTRKEKRTI
jgi:N-acetylmuramoyl-L-alanine amidase